MTGPRLSIGRGDFAKAIRLVSVALPRKGDLEARITFADGLLTLEAAGARTQSDATGEWPGVARASLRALKGVSTKLPSQDPLTIRHDAGRFYIEGWSVPSAWQDIDAGMLALTIKPEIGDLLAVAADNSSARIASSGLAKAVVSAELSVAATLKKAASILGPLGITVRDLEDLLNAKGFPKKGRD